jgi:type I restriction enzyme, R subunit
MDGNEAHQNQMKQLLSDPEKAANFSRIVFDLLINGNSRADF